MSLVDRQSQEHQSGVNSVDGSPCCAAFSSCERELSNVKV